MDITCVIRQTFNSMFGQFRYTSRAVWCLMQMRCSKWLIRLCWLLGSTATAAHATTVVPPSFTELVNGSDYIVRTVVKSVSSEWREQSGHRNIFTRVELEILEVVSGAPPRPLILEMLGGRVGDNEMVVHGVSQFAVGDEDILFVRGNGRQFYPLTAAMHGRYPVVREKSGRAFVARSNHTPLFDTSDVSLPMEENVFSPALRANAATSALTPEEFVKQIRAAVKANGRKSQP